MGCNLWEKNKKKTQFLLKMLKSKVKNSAIVNDKMNEQVIPWINFCPSIKQNLNNIHVSSRCSQTQWCIIRHIPMFFIGSSGQQQIYYLQSKIWTDKTSLYLVLNLKWRKYKQDLQFSCLNIWHFKYILLGLKY